MRKYIALAATTLLLTGNAVLADEMTTTIENNTTPQAGTSSTTTTITTPAPTPAPAPAPVIVPATPAQVQTKTKKKWFDFFGKKHVSKTKTESGELIPQY